MPAALTLEITDATQFATLFSDGRPVATLQRRRVYAQGPAWRAFDTNGAELVAFRHTLPASVMAYRVARVLGIKGDFANV